MKKLFLVFFVLSAVFAFTACGSDDPDPIPEDLTLKDNSPLVGTYTGKCTVAVTNIAGKDPFVTNESQVKLEATNDANILTLFTTQFNRVIDSRLANFKYVSSAKDSYTFSMNGFELKNFTETNMPTYVKNWFGSDFTKIESAVINLRETSAKYTVKSKTLEFVYDGTLKIKGKVDEKDRDSEEYQIKYTYSVIQD